ncbi:Bacteriophytochrome protein [Bradyrhizobium sp. ORS 278]|uniref:GAF domain-containing protein n=1 Tax=Bradyrhizobium sp. (strain ORS 278) TaxID=114615 RepID=UPI0001507D1C|nr:GAF domain-containing protein [Bradyrhizobium sp. ORS 278]CAL75164.1 Bacteriophytochrome protein [Bradyrhizobium sp. ORS 278]
MNTLASCIHNGRPAPCAHDSLPVARIGSCQPHGVMLVLTHGVDAIEHVSANVKEILGISVADALGRSPVEIFKESGSRERMLEILRPGRMFFDNPTMLTVNGRKFEAICHVRSGKLFIEIEPYVEAERDYATLVAEATEQLAKQRSIDGLYQCAVEMMNFVTGYDRVKLYKFVSHGHGQVVAEKHSETTRLPASFLHVFFAASDIPTDAMEILSTGKTRAKPQSGSPSVPLMTRSPDGGIVPTGSTLDLTDAWLRGIHECDNGYNRNLGVESNLIFPVNVDDRVWGLFVIHNFECKFLNYDSRVVIEQMTMMFISKLIELEALEARIDDRYKIASELIAAVDNGRRIIEQIGESRADSSWIHKKTCQMVAAQLAALSPRFFVDEEAAKPAAALEKFEVDLLNMMDADGAAIVRAGRHSHVRLIGSTPDSLTVRGIVAQFGDRLPSLAESNFRVFATDALPDMLPISGEARARACGMVATALGDESGNFILWFRAENVIDAEWAGQPPSRQELMSPKMFRPKTSFALHRQPLDGASRPWLEVEVRLAAEFGDAISAVWRKSLDRRRPADSRRRTELAGNMGGYQEQGQKSYGPSSGRLLMDVVDAPRLAGSLDFKSEYEPL